MLREPKSMEECVYMTNRFIGEKGSVRCWVFREQCPKCHKGLMGKPRDESGKVKIRAKEFVCPECMYTVGKEYEDTLTANIAYTCSKCEHSGDVQMPFKRKKMKMFDEEVQKQVTVDALQFLCQKCSEKTYVTKKLK